MPTIEIDEETGDEIITFNGGASVTITTEGQRSYYDPNTNSYDYNYQTYGDPVEWDSENLKSPETTWEHDAAEEAEFDSPGYLMVVDD